MQRRTLDWVLEEKKDIRGKTGNLNEIWSVVNSNVLMLRS